MTSDGTNTHVWDRANRLLSMGGHSYAYDGEGRRNSQTVSSVVTKYLLDVQPGLAQVIAATTGANTERYIHGPRGIQAMENSSGVWSWMLNDGQGSMRMVMPSGTGTVPTETRQYAPYGTRSQLLGSPQTEFGYMGEPLDGNGLIHLRARYYSPVLGVFASLDPLEGIVGRPMSLNGYGWVEGNTPNRVDPSGTCVIEKHARSILVRFDTCALAADNLSMQDLCCGTDITDWFLRELKNHTHYVEFLTHAIIREYLSDPLRALGTVIGNVSLIGAAVEQYYDQFYGPYALAIDYGFVDYDGVNRRFAASPACSQTGEEQTVSFCGVCHNSTDFGNLMFGATAYYAGIAAGLNDIFGVGFNVGSQGFGAFTSADTEAARVGYELGARLNTISSTSDLCALLNPLSPGWHDAQKMSGCENRRPCLSSQGDASLDSAPPSTPHFNTYISAQVSNVPRSPATPAEEWRKRFPLLTLNN